MARAFVALLAGFATMALIVIAMNAMFARLTPDWAQARGRHDAGYVFVNLGSSFLAAAAGGYVTAWAGAINPLTNVLALAIVVLVFGAISALQERGRQPIWYLAALLILTPLGVVAGGLVRLKVMGMV